MAIAKFPANTLAVQLAIFQRRHWGDNFPYTISAFHAVSPADTPRLAAGCLLWTLFGGEHQHEDAEEGERRDAEEGDDIDGHDNEYDTSSYWKKHRCEEHVECSVNACDPISCNVARKLEAARGITSLMMVAKFPTIKLAVELADFRRRYSDRDFPYAFPALHSPPPRLAVGCLLRAPFRGEFLVGPP